MDENLDLNKSKSVVRRKLSKEQETTIFALISRRRPFQLGLNLRYKYSNFYLWTRELVKQLVDQEFGVKLLNADVVNYLKRCGFSPLNRRKSKLDQCDTVIKKWLYIHLDTIFGRSKDEKAQVYWVGKIEMVGLQPSDKDRKKRLTMISVISNQGRVHWLIVSGEFTPKQQVKLLTSLKKQSRTKVFLIRRNFNHFNNELVNDWLNDNKSSIEIFPPAEWNNE